jgi:hypothetical protein
MSEKVPPRPATPLKVQVATPVTHEDVKLSINDQIAHMFQENKLEDLKRFMNKRKNLNACNTMLIYAFHCFQSAGILTTTIATGYNIRELIWVGVGLNVVSTLIHVFENVNKSISTKLMKDIQNIRDDKYVDEGTIVDDTKDEKKSGGADGGA